jgi:hypothetical protein
MSAHFAPLLYFHGTMMRLAAMRQARREKKVTNIRFGIIFVMIE